MSGNGALLDSNIFIYLSQKLLTFEDVFSNHEVFKTSIISYMEVMGYNFENDEEKQVLEELFDMIETITIDTDIAEKVIEIRRNKRIKLPDTIVYATASAKKLDLITRNTDDFKNIDDTVRIIDPFGK